jgi:L-2-hydroxyglutarate oxidase
VIVASTEAELPRLENLLERGRANGVEGLEMIGPERLRELEPHCVGVKALWSPNTGIVDFSRVVRAYADDVTAAGGEVLPGFGVEAISDRPGRVILQTPAGEVEAKHVVACAGLHADRVARLSGAPRDPRIVPFRGDYWVLRPDRRDLARNLIYPVPDPAFPFLGVHFTQRLDDGSVWLGPNAVLAFSREGYGRLDLRPRDLGEALAYRGFQKLAGKFWQTGMQEMVRDFSKQAFLKSLQVYVPELTLADLLPGPSGVRAQALGPDGALVDDFVVNTQSNRIVHVRNAPSPGATSSMAIGRMIADTASSTFGLTA